MNISISRWVTLILGIILLIAGVYFGIQCMTSKDLIGGLFALVGIVVGYVLLTGGKLTLSA